MNSIYRRLGGIAIALLMTPVLIGLLACMPVPIGDPERSRIDPELNGVWVTPGGDGIVVYLFEPYDKRTWFVESFAQYGAAWDDVEDPADITYERMIAEIGKQEPDQVGDESALSLKAWVTRLGRSRFMTWQPLGYEKWPEDKDDRMWYGFRFIKHSPDHFELHMIDAESDLFEGVEVTRRAYEKVIKKNAENAELYDSDGETARMPFFKLTEEDVQRLNNDW